MLPLVTGSSAAVKLLLLLSWPSEGEMGRRGWCLVSVLLLAARGLCVCQVLLGSGLWAQARSQSGAPPWPTLFTLREIYHDSIT